MSVGFRTAVISSIPKRSIIRQLSDLPTAFRAFEHAAVGLKTQISVQIHNSRFWNSDNRIPVFRQNVWNPDITSGFQTSIIYLLSEIRTQFCPVCQTGRPVLGQSLYTVCVRKPDVRFSAFSKCLRLLKRPDFRQRLKSRLKRPVIGRPVPMLYINRTSGFRTLALS